MSADPRLFTGIFSTGIGWCDRTIERHGDYKSLAFLDFGTLTLKIERGCPADLRALIEAKAAAIQERRGEPFQISTSGQTITLGHQGGR